MTKEVITACENDHNILILGSTGTGKSHPVKKIADALKKFGKNVQLTGTTGISSSLLNGITIHIFLGLKDGRYSADELSEKIQNDTIYGTVKKNIKTIDCIIIDEISMLSWKIFQQIEHVCRVVRENQKPFGGIQMILSGDFYQLKPISNIRYQDPGEIIISQPQFKHLIPHHVVLTEVFRQTEGT
jgi:ATP-dependent DNA helicase PIF1